MICYYFNIILKYKAMKSKTLVKFINDSFKFFGKEEDALQVDDVKPIVSVVHAAFNLIRYFFVQNANIAPLISTALFNARENTDYLQSDDEMVQCAIDVAASGISGFTAFGPAYALVSAGITGARCGIKLLDNGNMLSSIADAADALNNAHYTSNLFIRGFEVIKSGYAAGKLIDAVRVNVEEKLTSYVWSNEDYIPELFSGMLCGNAASQKAVIIPHEDI